MGATYMMFWQNFEALQHDKLTNGKAMHSFDQFGIKKEKKNYGDDCKENKVTGNEIPQPYHVQYEIKWLFQSKLMHQMLAACIAIHGVDRYSSKTGSTTNARIKMQDWELLG